MGLSYDVTDDGISYDKYLKFTKKWLSNVLHWTRPTGRLCLNVGLDKNKNGKHPVCADMTQLAKDVGWKYHATIIWNEGAMSRHTAWGSWMSASAPHVIAPVEVISAVQGRMEAQQARRDDHNEGRVYGMDEGRVAVQRRKKERAPGAVPA